jgi:Phage integrase, N-terminal SAM-like domain
MTTTIQSAATTLRAPGVEFEFDEAQLAAVSFLARYSGRTLEAYRHDLRGFFQWATDNRIVVLGANRAHIELFRAWMEDLGLAASTIDRNLRIACALCDARWPRTAPPDPSFRPVLLSRPSGPRPS